MDAAFAPGVRKSLYHLLVFTGMDQSRILLGPPPSSDSRKVGG